ncbi:MAG: methyltransferase domain-containing protein [Candidatus Natronoplasma sp.]
MMDANDIKIQKEDCNICGKCVNWCPKDAITLEEYPIIDREKCIFCGECMRVCPEDVIGLDEVRSNQNIYEDFTRVYSTGRYPEFSKAMARKLPDLLEKFDVECQRLLDVACGDGSFAVKMAEKGYDVVGIDISPQQIEIAKEKNLDEEIDFYVKDMRDLSFKERFDVATCWYDSLNYTLNIDDLSKVFQGVYNSLRKGGIFVFDMNTIYVMEEIWDEQTVVKEDSGERFDMVEQSYDEEKHITSLKLTSFLREDDECWGKIEEIHRERAYSFEEMRSIFKDIGFEELACWKDLEEKKEADEETQRVWFVLRR